MRQIRADGIAGTMRFVKRWILYKAYHHLDDKNYEVAEAVPTSLKVPATKLDYDEQLRSHSVEYLAAPRLLVHRAIGLIPESLTRFHFVDIGSGLGRPLLVASAYKFKTVIGYELSPSLHAGAVANIRCLSAPTAGEVKSVLGNALEAEWPSGPVVFFLFNPFDAEFMGRFLDRVQARQEDVYMLFLNFKHQDLIEQYPFQQIRLRPLEALFWRFASPYPIEVHHHNPVNQTAALEKLACIVGACFALIQNKAALMEVFVTACPI